jgi:hypothetical protein
MNQSTQQLHQFQSNRRCRSCISPDSATCLLSSNHSSPSFFSYIVPYRTFVVVSYRGDGAQSRLTVLPASISQLFELGHEALGQTVRELPPSGVGYDINWDVALVRLADPVDEKYKRFPALNTDESKPALESVSTYGAACHWLNCLRATMEH